MKKILLLIIVGGIILQGCNFMDVVPDDTPTLEHSFANEITTRNYLFTCYSGLPTESTIESNPAFLAGDEFWSWESLIKYPEVSPNAYYPWMIARGAQNSNSPYINYYEGELWKTIRKCNTFIERVDGVLGIREIDARQWKAEAKVIKAYCHFYLMRMYGPIPLIKDNLAIDSDTEIVRLKRKPWDECVNYVVQLLDEATPDLPTLIHNRTEELGRMTKAISLSLKAKILVTSASPQFNGNSYYRDFKNKDGEVLFGEKDDNKWRIAAEACKKAIDLCEEEAGMRLYEYKSVGGMPELVNREYTIRGSVTDKDWSSELIWGSIREPGRIQQNVQAHILPDGKPNLFQILTILGVTMKVAKQYYTSNGVPIEEDKFWMEKEFEQLRTAVDEERRVIRGITANFNFDREPRFYASLGFDRGVWYGGGRSHTNPFVLQGLYGQTANYSVTENTCITGYWAKKLINTESVQNTTTYSAVKYAWPILRLSDLYLLYAEALNESEPTPAADVYTYINLIRNRAGLKGVKESWAEYSKNPSKPNTRDGMREIIQRERLIELSLEGHRFWDLRRWLLAADYLSQPITGWNTAQKTPEKYYHETTIATQTFTAKDYLWPLSVSLLSRNPNLVQTIGW